MNHRILLAAATLFITPLMGCQSQLTGGEGNLLFSYTADDQVFDFNKAIAIGANLEIRVADAATRRPVELETVVAQNEDALTVESFLQDRFILKGVGDDNTQIDVEAIAANGDELTDFIHMRAEPAVQMSLSHTCRDNSEGTGYYLAGSTNVWLPFDLMNEDGNPVIGYGLFPVEFEPAASITLNETSTDQAFFHADLPATAGSVVMSSTLDDTTSTLEIVELTSIDGAEMNPASAAQRMIADETHVYQVWPAVGGERICQAILETTVESVTPEICEVRMVEETTDIVTWNEVGFFSVKGLAQGTCQFAVTYPGANAGAGATTTFDIEVAAFADTE